MNTLDPDLEALKAVKVSFQGETLRVLLADGQQIVVPTRLFPRLKFAKKNERRHYQLVGGGAGIHWPELDEDISVKGLLQRKGSAESSRSFVAWLVSRKKNGKMKDSEIQEIRVLPSVVRVVPATKHRLKHVEK